jgi:hypothetical protein
VNSDAPEGLQVQAILVTTCSQFLSNELRFIWLLISEDRLIMSSVAKSLVKLFEKRYTLLNGGVASLSS